MTDVYSGGLFREVLLDGTGEFKIANFVRETLVSAGSGSTHLAVGGFVREVLISAPAPEATGRRRQVQMVCS